MYEKMKKESTLKEEEIQQKYMYRLLENQAKGFHFCKIDKEDIKIVRKIYLKCLGYVVTSNGFLTWS